MLRDLPPRCSSRAKKLSEARQHGHRPATRTGRAARLACAGYRALQANPTERRHRRELGRCGRGARFRDRRRVVEAHGRRRRVTADAELDPQRVERCARDSPRRLDTAHAKEPHVFFGTGGASCLRLRFRQKIAQRMHDVGVEGNQAERADADAGYYADRSRDSSLSDSERRSAAAHQRSAVRGLRTGCKTRSARSKRISITARPYKEGCLARLLPDSLRTPQMQRVLGAPRPRVTNESADKRRHVSSKPTGH